MANLGEVDEVFEADQVLLKIGADSYGQLQEIDYNVDNPEQAEHTTNGIVVWFNGAGHNYVDAVLLATQPEISSLHSKTVRTNGALTEETWSIVGTAKDGSTRTITFTATLPKFRLRRPTMFAVKIHIRLRITGTSITVT